MKTIYKFIFLFLFALAGFTASAQDSHTTNTSRKWFLPDHVTIQFAGNIGMFSAGPGYSYLKDRINTDFLYGIVPGFEAKTSIHILTAKNYYTPFKINLNDNFQWEALKLGTGVSYSLGHQFFTTLPKRYSDNYYWWASSLRFTPFIGTAISTKVGNEATAIKRLQLYAEIGTTDLDLVSKIDNESLPLSDIINLAIGTKVVF
jgi:hypothetical protein